MVDLASLSTPPDKVCDTHKKLGEMLNVAIAPVISPEKSLEIYRDFVEYIAKKMGRAAIAQEARL